MSAIGREGLSKILDEWIASLETAGTTQNSTHRSIQYLLADLDDGLWLSRQHGKRLLALPDKLGPKQQAVVNSALAEVQLADRVDLAAAVDRLRPPAGGPHQAATEAARHTAQAQSERDTRQFFPACRPGDDPLHAGPVVAQNRHPGRLPAHARCRHAQGQERALPTLIGSPWATGGPPVPPLMAAGLLMLDVVSPGICVSCVISCLSGSRS